MLPPLYEDGDLVGRPFQETATSRSLMVALAANFVGDGLRDAIDPKLCLR
jgi:hypothetical protein